jgi:hypothetical protein
MLQLYQHQQTKTKMKSVVLRIIMNYKSRFIHIAHFIIFLTSNDGLDSLGMFNF